MFKFSIPSLRFGPLTKTLHDLFQKNNDAFVALEDNIWQKWSSWESNPEPSPLSNAHKSSAKKMSYH
jgi:hypothetical protein